VAKGQFAAIRLSSQINLTESIGALDSVCTALINSAADVQVTPAAMARLTVFLEDANFYRAAAGAPCRCR